MLDRARSLSPSRPDLGHPAGLVAVVLVLVTVVGVLGRLPDPAGPPDPATEVLGVSADASPDAPLPAEFTVASGTTLATLLPQLEELGIDSDEFSSLVNEPEWAGLEGTPWAASTLETFLFPDTYSVATTSARALLTDMIQRVQRTGRLETDAAGDDIFAAALVRRAGEVQALTNVVAEMPLAAELLASGTASAAPVAPSADAIRAAGHPSAFGPSVAATLLIRSSAPISSEPTGRVLRDLVAAEVRGSTERVGLIIGGTARQDVAVGPERLFPLGGLDGPAVAYAARALLANGTIDPDSPLVVDPALLPRLLPEPRRKILEADVRTAVDLAITEGHPAAGAVLVHTIGAERLERMLHQQGITSTSLRSAPPVTTASDVFTLARLLDRAGGPGSSNLDRLFAGRPGDLMARPFVERNGFASFGARTPGTHHEIARVLDGGRARLVVALTDGGEESRRAARHTAHTVALHAMHYPASPRSEGCAIEPSALGRLGGVTVGLDPGHGGNDPGAISPSPGAEVEEADVNLALSLGLADRLARRGARVVLTRCDDTSVALGDRAHILNSSGTDLILSIHVDARPDPLENDSLVLWHGNDERDLATAIAGDSNSGLAKRLNGTNNIDAVTTRADPIGLLLLTMPPAVVIEPVTLSHPPEAQDLVAALDGRSTRITTIVDGILDGVLEAATPGEPRRTAAPPGG